MNNKDNSSSIEWDQLYSEEKYLFKSSLINEAVDSKIEQFHLYNQNKK